MLTVVTLPPVRVMNSSSQYQTGVYLAVTEAHFFLSFPPWIADHYSLPPCSSFSCFGRVLTSSPLPPLRVFCIPLTSLCSSPLLDFWSFSVFSSGFCPDGLPWCSQLLQLWPYLCWMYAATFPTAAVQRGTCCSLLRLQDCMPMWHLNQQWNTFRLLCLGSHLMCRALAAGWHCGWVTPCAWGHPPGHSLTMGESTLSIPVLDVPSMSSGLCFITVLLFIHPRQQHGLDDFCSPYYPQWAPFLQKYYLFHISVTGFSHQHSGPCT